MLLGNIPVNVITGFLGAGKTSFIKQLLAQKPEEETWAVLVNEFGEVGLDAALLGRSQGLVIREVPGGCICCAAGVPTRVAVAQLLRQARPSRLLIEPTGLGHPANILKTLMAPEYQGVLSIQRTLCLVDPRNLSDARYTQNDIFNQQLAVADLVLACKADVQAPDFLATLGAYVSDINPGAPVFPFSAKGPFSEALLTAMMQTSTRAPRLMSPAVPRGLFASKPSGAMSLFDEGDGAQTLQFNAQGFIRKPHQADGIFACGWCFSAGWCFDFDALMAVVEANPSLRLKAVMITADGILAINRLDTELSLAELDDAMDSRIEFIATAPLDWDAIEGALLKSAGLLR
ncbi:CobW family GTP-binding protein [Shewanella litorisediminis]|uniref:GTP-binding protein n=1 Tax=Shewanella litorisediminis TaxID=1173586 RepID=A0ABX7G0B2_9GAMM|nr:GTP-binding protein [Shewanella litorisediminis]MCL2918215.1 GTP-binding protein [Shewanella litorisediminis]QRH00734.1 GTP-binding protein [Shewanella litorisediminis]